MSEDIIRAADVLEDIHRLPHVGFALDVRPDYTQEPQRLRAKITMSNGGEPQTLLHLRSCAISHDELVDAQRRFSLVRAALAFLNTGGDPEDLAELTGQLKQLPELQFSAFKLLDIHEDVSLEFFLVDDTGQIVRVLPGVFAEPITREEYDELKDVFYDTEESDD